MPVSRPSSESSDRNLTCPHHELPSKCEAGAVCWAGAPRVKASKKTNHKDLRMGFTLKQIGDMRIAGTKRGVTREEVESRVCFRLPERYYGSSSERCESFWTWPFRLTRYRGGKPRRGGS